MSAPNNVLKEFTFIALTYNHEEYIVEHLDSIKYLIETFGRDIKCDLIIADDVSKDQTIDVVERWLENEKNLFREVQIIKRKKNIGTIRNIQDAITRTKTKAFKFLAGDDKYYINNIFELFREEAFIITPILPTNSNAYPNFKNSYRLLLAHNSVEKMRKLLRYECHIPAPGVFVSADYYRDPSLWDALMKFRLIEDYPSWYYIFNHYNDMNLKIETRPYICYRIGSGVSSDSSPSSGVYSQEKKDVYTYVKNKLVFMPKYINVYRYIFKAIKNKANTLQNEATKKIDELYKQ